MKKIRMCDEAEEALMAEDDYATASDRPDQPEYLKSLDDDDIIVKGWRVFNLCKGKNPRQ